MKALALSVSKKDFLSTKAVFFIVATILVSVFFLYVYFVNKVIMNVVAREKITSNISGLSTTIGDLEYKYMTLKNSVTLDLAHAKGFQDATPSTFLARETTHSSLSYNSAR